MPPIHPDLTAYDAGLLNDFGGGNVDWWWDYIRAELERAHDHYAAQFEAVAKPDALMAEMLEALKGLVGDHTVGGTWRTEGAVIDNARAVIAKAESPPSTVEGR